MTTNNSEPCSSEENCFDRIHEDQVLPGILQWLSDSLNQDISLKDDESIYTMVDSCINSLKNSKDTEITTQSKSNTSKEILKNKSNYKTFGCQGLLCLLAVAPHLPPIEQVHSKLAELCSNGLLSKYHLYLALAARSNLMYLNAFLERESGIERGFLESNRDIIMELFLLTVKKKSHWLSHIVDSSAQLLSEGNVTAVEHLLSQDPIKFVWPLLLLKLLKERSNLSALKVAVKHTVDSSDPTLSNLALGLDHQLQVLSWLEKVHSKEWIIPDIYTKSTSTLLLLHHACGLTNLGWEQAHHFLEEKLKVENVDIWEVATLDAFMACFHALKSIVSSLDIDWQLTEEIKEQVADVYSCGITKHLQEMKKIVCQLQPLTTRLEVLETIFSFLFLRFEDFYNENGSDSGAEEDVNQSNYGENPPLAGFSCWELTSSSLQSIPSIAAQVAVHGSSTLSTLSSKLKEKPLPPSLPRNVINDQGVVLRTSSYRRHGFLCSRHVTRDLLSILQECLLKTSAAYYSSLSEESSDSYGTVQSSIPKQEIQQHIHQLTLHTTEAMWRLEVLTSKDFVDRVGEVVPVLIGVCAPPPPDWVYPYCLDDDSTSDDDVPGVKEVPHGKIPRRRSDTDKSSESGSHSTPTGSSSAGKKWSRRSRKKSSGVPYPVGSNDNIIKKMLSSNTSLVAQCLLHGDTVTAKGVIQFFGMDGSQLATEVIFTEAYHELQHRLSLCSGDCKINHRSKGESSYQNSTLKAIQRVASAGVQTSSLLNEVENFLTSFTLPCLPDSNRIPPEMFQFFGGSPKEQPMAIAAADLALTLASSYVQATSFLGVALKYCKELRKLHTTSFSKSLGFLPLLQNLLQSPGQSAESPMEVLHRWDITDFSARTLRDFKQFWNALETILNELQSANISSSFITLMQIASSSPFLRWEESRRTHHYLQEMQSYLKALSRNIHRDPYSTIDTLRDEHFLLLQENPSTLFSNVIHKDKIPPLQLEEISVHLGCNLAHLLTLDLCSVLPSIPQATVECTVSKDKPLGIHVLNGGNFVGPARHPLDVVDTLLGLLLEALNKQLHKYEIIEKTVCGWLPLSSVDTKLLHDILIATWELSAIKLELLQPGPELLCFYCNLTNLMWVHSLLHLKLTAQDEVCHSLVWGCPIEQLASQNSLAYNVGGLGIVTLWEIRYLTLGADLVFPSGTSSLRSIAHSIDYHDPRVLFSITTGTNCSPRIQVLKTANLESDLQKAVQDYVRYWLHIEPGQVLVPSQVQMYIQHTGKDMRTFLMECCGGSMQDQLDASPEDVAVIQLIENRSRTQITFSYAGTHEELIVRPSRDEPVSKPKPTENENVLLYLKRQCPLLEAIIRALLSETVLLETDSDDEPKEAIEMDETTCAVGLTVFEGYPVLERLCGLQEVSTLSLLYNDCIALSAINSTVPLDLIWDFVDVLIVQGRWQTVVEVLQAFPQPQVQNDMRLTALFDLALMEMSLQPEDSVEPWRYCERINSQCLRVRCILAGSAHWPGAVCQAQLQAVLNDPMLDCVPDIREQAVHLLFCVKTYQQIVDCVDKGPWKSWQDVLQVSQSDPLLVLDSIISTGDAELCLSWMELHKVPTSQSHLITGSVMALLLDAGSCSLFEAERVLCELPRGKRTEVCFETFHWLRTIPALKFCVHFLKEVCGEELTKNELETLQHINIGIQMVEVIPESDQADCIALVCHPHLMLEQLVMNMRLEAADQMVSRVRTQLMELSPMSPLCISAIDLMLRKYATKALEFRVVQGSTASQSSDNTLTASLSSHSVSKEFIMPPTVPSKADWTPNEKATQCMRCELISFSMFNRRHHCRRCGHVVCATCSSNKMLVEGYGSLKVRVCDHCYTQSSIQREVETPSPSKKTVAPSCEDGSIPPDNQWHLTDSESLNCTIREEFAYEQHAPSVSLCLSILKLHSKHAAYPAFLLDACDSILGYLQPHAPGVPNPEVDPALVIQMCRSLVVAAKVKSAQWEYYTGEAQSDLLLSRIDFINLLVSHGCTALIPKKADMHELSVLRNQLIDEELWELALEFSTKVGLERTCIWAAWGKGCLRAGRWKEAREKFAQCMFTRSKSSFRSTSDSPLLLEILQILEDTPHAMDREVLKKAEALLKQTETLRALSKRIAPPAPAVAVLHSLASLKNITEGKIPQGVKDQKWLDPLVYSECCYYLCEYGSHASYLRFLVRHKDFTIALKHTLSNSLNHQLFVDWVYMPCLRTGQITPLHSAMTAIDPSLVTWKVYLHGICAALERHKLWHTLYEVQQWSKDHVRAAMTCIHFYHDNARSYAHLAANLNHLMRAQSHLEAALAVASVSSKYMQAASKTEFSSDNASENSGSVESGNQSETLWLQLSPQELDHHLSTVCRQVELTKFLSACESEGRSLTQVAKTLPQNFTLPLSKGLLTLFGNGADRCLLAGLAILCGTNVEEGYGIAFRIIEGFKLNAQEIYEAVATSLVLRGHVIDVQQLIGCIRSSGASNTTRICDCVLSTCVPLIPEQFRAAHIDTLVRSISERALQIKAYTACGQLKSAYLLAVKYQNQAAVQHHVECILREAERLDQVAMQKICLKRLGRS